jgi:WD40 repeat protein
MLCVRCASPTRWFVACAQGSKLITASSDKTCRLWDCETGECLAVLEGHIDEIFSCVPPHHWVAVPRGLHPLRPNVIVHVYCHCFHPPHS